jgi:hypothetical protein
MSNVNRKITVISSVQASGADVSATGGELVITGVEPILISNIQGGSYSASTLGIGLSQLVAATAAVAGSTTYDFSIKQVTEDRTYILPVSYTTAASAPSDTAFYAALEALVQAGITGNQILGTVSSSSSGVVFVPAATAAVAEIKGSLFTVTPTANTLTAAGSSVTSAAPRVFTAGAAHGLTSGRIYKITFSGATSTGADDLNRTLYGIVTGATTIALYGTSATGVPTTTSATITVENISTEDFSEVATGITGYNSSTNYVAVGIDALSVDAVDAGSVLPYLILAEAGTAANINAFVNALRTALASTPAAIA